MRSRELSEKLDKILSVEEIEDKFLNGLIVENKREIKKAAFAVDASLYSFEKAKTANADILICHHGIMFKGGNVPIVGRMYDRIRFLIVNDIALYVAHLPLDVHPQLGNNAQAVNLLGGREGRSFANFGDLKVGKEIIFPERMGLEELIQIIEERLDTKAILWRFGDDIIRSVGYVSGGGIEALDEAIELGFDAFVTGEPLHSAYWKAKEAGINCIFAGHYATETLGVKALGEYIKREFGIEIEFLDLPTGH